MTSYQLNATTKKLTNQDIYQMSHGRHVYMDYKAPPPRAAPSGLWAL